MRPLPISVATLFLLLFWNSSPQASDLPSIRGTVSSTDEGGPLAGAVIAVAGTGIGSYADSAGSFLLSRLPAGSYELVVSCLGYAPRRVAIELTRDRVVTIELTPSAITLPGVVVSATRRTQTFVETPVSMGVADARQIAAHNSFTLAAPLRYQSGVSQIGGQVNIRGSSGFSRGTGSRVLLLLDGFPLLSADLEDIKWDAIPVGEVERMEIIKGAGSALYGTGALGGVINLITRQPTKETRTDYRLVNGLFSQPAHRSWRWRDDPMYLTGADVSHNRTIGATGLVAAMGLKRSTGYHENDDFTRYNLYAKAVHRFRRTTWTSQVLWALDDHGVFLQWKDRSRPLEVPNEDRHASTASWKFNLNSEVRRMLNPSAAYSVRGFYYRTGFDNTRAAGGLNSSAHKIGSEMQLDYTGWRNIKFTGGSLATMDVVQSPEDFLGRRRVTSVALFSQGEYAFRKNLDLALGIRLDHHRRGGTRTGVSLCPQVDFGRAKRRSETRLSPQIGFSYRPLDGTALRASAGRGFRAPSVSEIHTQVEASGVLVCADPNLRSEHSWSYEAGIRQLLVDRISMDGALFWSEYEDLVEARPDPLAISPVPVARFRNLSKARVRGAELATQAALPLGMRWRVGYTFLDAVEFLARDVILPPFCSTDLTPGKSAPLPYRSRHQLTTELEATWRNVTIGGGFRYLSRFERVSGLFPECRRDFQPIYLTDLFARRRLGPVELNLRVDNLLQYHYVLTERKIRPTRRLSLAISGQL
jgi:outer membrane receptor for ferrienterochelin and colicins